MSRTFWFVLLGGHVAWSLHLMVSYFLADLACASGDGALWTFRHVITLAAAAVTAAAAAVAWQQHRRPSRSASPQTADDPAEPHRFLARFALVLSGVFLLAIVLAGSTNLFLRPCV